MAWLFRQARDAGFAALPAPAGASLAASATVWFGRWRAGPLRGDDRVELRLQQVLVGAEQLNELLGGGPRGIHAVAAQDLRHHSDLVFRR
jgi:hypothetical protein